MSMRDPQASRDVRPGPVAVVRAFFARLGKVLMAGEEASAPSEHPDAGPEFRAGQPGSAAPGRPATSDTPAPSGPHAGRRGADQDAGSSLYGPEGDDADDAEPGGGRGEPAAQAATPGDGPLSPGSPAPETARGQFRPQGETGNVRLIPARRPAATTAASADPAPEPVAGPPTREPAASAGLAAAAAPADDELADAGMVGAAPARAAATGFSDDGWTSQLGPDTLAGEAPAAGRPELDEAEPPEPAAAGQPEPPGPSEAGQPEPAGPSAAGPAAGAAATAAGAAATAAPDGPGVPAGAEVPAGPEAALPLPNYGSLSLPSLRARLRHLDVAQLQVLLDYERAHAGREAVLAMFANRIAKISDGPS